MRTSAPPQCALEAARNRRHGNVFRRGGHAGPCRAGGTGRDGSDPRGTGARFGRGAEFACAPPSPPPPGVAPLEIIPAGRRRSTPSPFSDDGAGRPRASIAAALPTGRIGCRPGLGMRRGDGRADVARGRGRRPRRCRAAADRVSVARVGHRGVRRPVRRFHARGLRVPHLPRRGERGRGGSRRHPPAPLRHVFVAAGSCGLHGEAGSRFAREDMRAEADGRTRRSSELMSAIPRPPGEMYAVDHWRYFQFR